MCDGCRGVQESELLVNVLLGMISLDQGCEALAEFRLDVALWEYVELVVLHQVDVIGEMNNDVDVFIQVFDAQLRWVDVRQVCDVIKIAAFGHYPLIAQGGFLYLRFELSIRL